MGQMLMNPATGSVASENEWYEDYRSCSEEEWGGPHFEDAGLVEVTLENGQWVEA